MSVSQTRLKYLLEIYRISEQKQAVHSAEIAETLGVRRPTVTRMLKSLLMQSLITKESYGEVYLTRKGYRLAREYFNSVNRMMKLLPSLCPEMNSRQMYEAACAVAAILPLPAAAERKLQ